MVLYSSCSSPSRFGSSTFEQMRAENEISKARLAELLKELDERQSELHKELTNFRQSIQPTIDEEQLTGMFAQFESWDMLTRDERRSLLTVLIPRYRIESAEVVEIYWL